MRKRGFAEILAVILRNQTGPTAVWAITGVRDKIASASR